ncbi:7995_t:CDS:10 [Entrophospora sp. SA101]|nr:7995_t:CDS:10 [Entrophospora sp. SA101]
MKDKNPKSTAKNKKNSLQTIFTNLTNFTDKLIPKKAVNLSPVAEEITKTYQIIDILLNFYQQQNPQFKAQVNSKEIASYKKDISAAQNKEQINSTLQLLLAKIRNDNEAETLTIDNSSAEFISAEIIYNLKKEGRALNYQEENYLQEIESKVRRELTNKSYSNQAINLFNNQADQIIEKKIHSDTHELPVIEQAIKDLELILREIRASNRTIAYNSSENDRVSDIEIEKNRLKTNLDHKKAKLRRAIDEINQEIDTNLTLIKNKESNPIDNVSKRIVAAISDLCQGLNNEQEISMLPIRQREIEVIIYQTFKDIIAEKFPLLLEKEKKSKTTLEATNSLPELINLYNSSAWEEKEEELRIQQIIQSRQEEITELAKQTNPSLARLRQIFAEISPYHTTYPNIYQKLELEAELEKVKNLIQQATLTEIEQAANQTLSLTINRTPINLKITSQELTIYYPNYRDLINNSSWEELEENEESLKKIITELQNEKIGNIQKILEKYSNRDLELNDIYLTYNLKQELESFQNLSEILRAIENIRSVNYDLNKLGVKFSSEIDGFEYRLTFDKVNHRTITKIIEELNRKKELLKRKEKLGQLNEVEETILAQSNFTNLKQFPAARQNWEKLGELRIKLGTFKELDEDLKKIKSDLATGNLIKMKEGSDQYRANVRNDRDQVDKITEQQAEIIVQIPAACQDRRKLSNLAGIFSKKYNQLDDKEYPQERRELFASFKGFESEYKKFLEKSELTGANKISGLEVWLVNLQELTIPDNFPTDKYDEYLVNAYQVEFNSLAYEIVAEINKEKEILAAAKEKVKGKSPAVDPREKETKKTNNSPSSTSTLPSLAPINNDPPETSPIADLNNNNISSGSNDNKTPEETSKILNTPSKTPISRFLNREINSSKKTSSVISATTNADSEIFSTSQSTLSSVGNTTTAEEEDDKETLSSISSDETIEIKKIKDLKELFDLATKIREQKTTQKLSRDIIQEEKELKGLIDRFVQERKTAEQSARREKLIAEKKKKQEEKKAAAAAKRKTVKEKAQANQKERAKWQNDAITKQIKTQTTETEINQLRDNYLESIQQAKVEERQKQAAQTEVKATEVKPTPAPEEKQPTSPTDYSRGEEFNSSDNSLPKGGNNSQNYNSRNKANLASEENIVPPIIQAVLAQAQQAIASQKITELQAAESQITELFAEKDPNKQQVYYHYQKDLGTSLEKVIQTKTIQEIQINHLKVINNTPLEKIPTYKKAIQSDILQQTKQVAIGSIVKDLSIARVIKLEIYPQKDKKSKQNILTQSQTAVINNLHSLLGQELKITDLDSPFQKFPTETLKKELTELTTYQQEVAAHIADKKRRDFHTADLNDFSYQIEDKWQQLTLPISPLLGAAVGIQIKLLINKYHANLRKLEKVGYQPQLVREIKEDLQQIQKLTEQLEKGQKTKFDQKK